MVAEGGVWSSFPERGQDKEKKGAGDGALGGSQFEGIRRGQRREQPGMASFCFQALVPMPGVRSSRDGGFAKEHWVPARAIHHGNEGTQQGYNPGVVKQGQNAPYPHLHTQSQVETASTATAVT